MTPREKQPAGSAAPSHGAVVVFHAGALGDWVLTWPWIRAMVRAGEHVVLVCESEKGRLAERVIGDQTRDAPGSVRAVEEHAGTPLWRGREGMTADAAAQVRQRIGPAKRVVSFVADPAENAANRGAGRAWWDAACAVWGDAARERAYLGGAGGPERNREWAAAHVETLGFVERRASTESSHPERTAGIGRAAVLHVGAGSREKMWSMANWIAAAQSLREQIASPNDASIEPVRLIAGHVEQEKLGAAERKAFENAGGEWLETLENLRQTLENADVFAGADSGPGHLAAQMGLGVVSVFGPSDERLWRPVGRPGKTRVLASGGASGPVGSPQPRATDYVRVEHVVACLRTLASVEV